MQRPRSSEIRWRSEPPSIRGFDGIGYGPGSDSDAYWNETVYVGVAEVTMLYGMPSPMASKSGWR